MLRTLRGVGQQLAEPLDRRIADVDHKAANGAPARALVGLVGALVIPRADTVVVFPEGTSS